MKKKKVFSVEGDVQVTGAEENFATWKLSKPWYVSLRGRVVYALNNLMFYGIGGLFFFFQAEDGIRGIGVTGVQTCALPISRSARGAVRRASRSRARRGSHE